MKMSKKLNFPNTISAKALAKKCMNYTTPEKLSALSDGRLVVAWDTPDCEDAPTLKYYGFLDKITFDSNGSVRYEVYCPNEGYTFVFDHAEVVEELSCPKVYYNDGELQGVGHLVGMLKPVLGVDTNHHTCCRLRVPPWSEVHYRSVGVDQITFVVNITLGITKEEEDNNA